MKKLFTLFLALVMVLPLAACGGKSVMSTKTISIDSVCVDDDYRDSDGSTHTF